MKFIQEYALLIAVATPVLVIVGMQVWLFMTGERGTLLLPSLRRFPSVDISAAVKALEAMEVPAVEHASSQPAHAMPAWLVGLTRRTATTPRVAAESAVKEERMLEKAA